MILISKALAAYNYKNVYILLYSQDICIMYIIIGEHI